MSTLTAYRDWLSTAQDCLDGIPPPADAGRFRPQWPVPFPLTGLPPLKEIHGFYQNRFVQIEKSGLAPHRKALYTQYIQQVYYAYAAVERGRPPRGTVADLRSLVVHLLYAVNLMAETKDFDDANQIHGLEWAFLGSTEANMSPEDSWQSFKLESIWPCILLSVKILRLLFPDCSGVWNECDKGLRMNGWSSQFVIDSKSQYRGLPLYAPRRSDIIGPAFRGR
ncbi:hypothetical protein F5X99DRAFT_259865 [Biscogniauxia marginata]|nr:hypothetical protein F5X99DRAFT_259865 [Biscogniauxia marginata]